MEKNKKGFAKKIKIKNYPAFFEKKKSLTNNSIASITNDASFSGVIFSKGDIDGAIITGGSIQLILQSI